MTSTIAAEVEAAKPRADRFTAVQLRAYRSGKYVVVERFVPVAGGAAIPAGDGWYLTNSAGTGPVINLSTFSSATDPERRAVAEASQHLQTCRST